MCQKCFKYLIAGYEILKVEYNFCILWTFSGSRGIHCWVFEKKAKEMPVKVRIKISKMSNYESGEEKWYFSYSIKQNIKNIFTEILTDSPNLFFLESNKNIFLNHLPNDELKHQFVDMIKKLENSLSIWIMFIGLVETYLNHQANGIISEVISTILYPKIDDPITTQKKHLLRMPFSIHSKTGNICVPIINIYNYDLK